MIWNEGVCVVTGVLLILLDSTREDVTVDLDIRRKGELDSDFR